MSRSSVLAVIILTACGSTPAPAEPAKTEPTTTVAPGPAKPEPEKPAVAKPAPRPGEPGPAYFAVADRGVVRLRDGEFTELEGAPASSQRSMQLGPDGALWLIRADDILRLDGDRFTAVTKADLAAVGGTPEHLAVGPDGVVWVTSGGGVARWDGRAWAIEDRAKIGAGDDPLIAITVDREGKVWVASPHRVHLRDAAGAWQEVGLKQATRAALDLEDLALAPDGAVHILLDGALLRVGAAPNQLTALDVGGKKPVHMTDMAISLNGSIAVQRDRDVHHLPAGGSARAYSSAGSRDFAADNISAVAPDDAGRLWVGSDLGVSVIAPGAPRVLWPSGSVPGLVGKIGAIVVVGAGPRDLPAAAPVARGGLTGTVVRGGAPLADAAIELCPTPSASARKSPCHDAPIKFAGKTDAAGVWTVDGVPLGVYRLAIQSGKRWILAPALDLGDGMKPGVVRTTGTVSLDEP